jgi:glutamate formiminotransferase/formiminotetrahydrofolate cyclodeaminase
VDPGKATNRTVVTFAGAPEAVIEAAFRAIQMAAELIDMRQHQGEHPRMGATDVCPLIPISGITLEETALHARRLAERVARELRIPVYLYEAAQPDPARKNLAVIRAGEYEGLARKLEDPRWAPDFGPAEFNPRSGATVIGARDFLVAFNVNLNTTSTRRANAVAFDVREAGRPKREGDPVTGKVVNDAAGQPVMIPGTLKAVKAIGWFIEEYGIAQVSMNLTDLSVTPLHIAFEEVCRKAEARGMRVTGSELVGLVPLSALLEAGRYFLRKQQRSVGVSDHELMKIAIRSMGLDELAPFDPSERVLEYRLAKGKQRCATDLFDGRGASPISPPARVPRPAVARCPLWSEHSAPPLERWWPTSRLTNGGGRRGGKNFPPGQNGVSSSRSNCCVWSTRTPKPSTPSWPRWRCPREPGKNRRRAAKRWNTANRRAVEVPLEVMRRSLASFELLMAMAQQGNPGLSL